MQKAKIAASSGEMDLSVLLSNLNPTLDKQLYVFTTIANDTSHFVPEFPVKGLFRENEGYTCILERTIAKEQGFDCEDLYCCITCEVHSSLNAVGLTAAFSVALAEHEISANVIAGYFHDHVFIPAKYAQKAMKVLQSLSLDKTA